MQEIRDEHIQLLQGLDTIFYRAEVKNIGWEERLLFLKGARGVGKSTLILQYIKETFGFDTKALYVTMDSINVANTSIIEIAQNHYNSGGTHLFIDEVHKYENWSIELKNIYDKIKKLKVTVSGSSMLDLYKGNADLSRRGVTHILHGLSLREFINIEAKLDIQHLTLDDIIENHVKIADRILKQINPLAYFHNYLKHGYYPFYLEGTKYFHQKLNNAINQVIEIDIPRLHKLEISNVNKVKKLLYIIGTSVPFQLNSTKLAEALDLNRQTLNTYLNYLQEGEILNLLWNSTKNYSLISKPDKVYLQNTNLCNLIPAKNPNTGNIRETFFMNQVSALHQVNTALQGDFTVDNKYIFEVGGNNKKFKQIANLPNSFVATDNQLIGQGNKIPLWMFGYLY